MTLESFYAVSFNEVPTYIPFFLSKIARAKKREKKKQKEGAKEKLYQHAIKKRPFYCKKKYCLR